MYINNNFLITTCLLFSSASFANTEITKIDLGTLNSDNLGYSFAYVISADGRVVVGHSEVEDGTQQVFRCVEGCTKIIGLGTLRSDNTGNSYAESTSADGRVIVGQAAAENGYLQAFKYTEGDSKMTGLGTLRADNSGFSNAYDVSADGRVIVGQAAAENGYEQAFRYTEGDLKMTGLGTLRADNTGDSAAYDVSADGRVIVGQAAAENGYEQAFRYIEGDSKMTGLGTLRSDDIGSSIANATSSDGRVIVGQAATDNGYEQAFRYTEGDSKMTGLGTLRSDNTGKSTAYMLSANGHVTVGSSETDSGYLQAFRYTEGDERMVGLGTLKADNTGNSIPYDISADGRIIIGHSETDSGYHQAFRYTEGDSEMISLGTLRADDTGFSSADAISSDGLVMTGNAQTENGSIHAAVWKVLTPQNPESPIIIVDATNSNKTMIDSANKTYQVLDLYRSRLMSLSETECSLGSNNYCIGLFTNFDGVKSNNTFATGIFGALKINQQWSIGLSIDYLADSSLPSGFKTRGSSTPGIGGFINYQTSSDASGFNVKLSGAFQEQKISITRQQLNKTEAGTGDTKITSHLIKLGASYGIKLTEEIMIFPHANIVYTEVARDAYTENRNAHFPASFGKASDKRTSLELGLKTNYDISKTISLHTDVGAYINLKHNRKNFTGNIDYIGAHVYDIGNEKKIQPYITLGMQAEISKNSVINLKTRWSKQAYNNDSFNIGLSYSYRF